MNYPKRTQEIASILCQLLDGDTELSRKIVELLKDQETDCSRIWHIHRLSTRKWYRKTCGLDNGLPRIWDLREYIPRGEEAELWDFLVDQLQDYGRLITEPINFQWVKSFIRNRVNKDLSVADRIDISNGIWDF